MLSGYALVAKLADALDSGSSGATLGGSNPLERTKEARDFYPPEAKLDWAMGGCSGAKSSRAPTGVNQGMGWRRAGVGYRGGSDG